MSTVTFILSPAVVRARIAGLRELDRVDRDAACAGADELRCDVLAAIAHGHTSDPRALAQEALRTLDENIGGG
ncbi:MAG: hypothetical protein JOY99_05325 [Sphingomonadaceae bacterium]|nr:hypothetical protein [Sphingomonadaceae bacterium]